MQELRLVAVSEDGTYVVLAQPGRASRFSLPNDERLRAVVRGQFSRLAQYEIEVESPLRPKEIQARIRSGETAEQIADAANVPIERVRWFEGPVLAERAYIAQQAQTASVRRPGDSGPGPRLGEVVAERLRVLGADPDEARWDSRKRGDGSWLVELTSETGVERLTAEWVFDPRRRHAMPDDDAAARLSLSEDALQAAGLAIQPTAAARGGGTVTPFVPRSHLPAQRPAAEPDSEPESQRASTSVAQPVAQPVSQPVAQPVAQPVSQPVAQPTGQPVSQPVRPASRHAAADATERGRRSADVQDRQPPSSGMPGLKPPERGTRRGQVPEPSTPQALEPDPRQPEAPVPGTQRRPAAQHAPAASATAPTAASTASTAASATEPAPVDEAPATAEAQPEPPARRSARKAAGGRGRRSSVPTWDEIMFGSSRRQD